MYGTHRRYSKKYVTLHELAAPLKDEQVKSAEHIHHRSSHISSLVRCHIGYGVGNFLRIGKPSNSRSLFNFFADCLRELRRGVRCGYADQNTVCRNTEASTL